jgi:hypothetical protein
MRLFGLKTIGSKGVRLEEAEEKGKKIEMPSVIAVGVGIGFGIGFGFGVVGNELQIWWC